jgi:hypothetical protein
MAEAGTALGICTNSMVLGDSKKQRTYIQAPQDREWGVWQRLYLPLVG